MQLGEDDAPHTPSPISTLPVSDTISSPRPTTIVSTTQLSGDESRHIIRIMLDFITPVMMYYDAIKEKADNGSFDVDKSLIDM